MKRKELLDHGRIRILTESETSAVVGGNSSVQVVPVVGQSVATVVMFNIEGTLSENISPSRKNIELVPTAGVELATY